MRAFFCPEGLAYGSHSNSMESALAIAPVLTASISNDHQATHLELLFVDDEQRVLDGLQRMLRPMRHEWAMRFCISGEAALTELNRQRADVVVSDMRMPGMSGAELLGTVMRLWPATVRIILSGHADAELVHRTVGPTHQYLQKPCDTEVLKSTVTRASRLRSLLAEGRLRDLVGNLKTLPSQPDLYFKLVGLMQAQNANMAAVGELVAQDLGMTVKLLQLVNSAFFGLKREVARVQDAVNMLGMETLQALVLSVHAFSAYEESRCGGLNTQRLWQHSHSVAQLARRIAQAENQLPVHAEETYLAAMMHDVGKLVLAVNLPEDFSQVRVIADAQHLPDHEAERIIFGASHAEVGAYLLGLWGISDPVVEAVAWHHHPALSERRGFSAIAAVHVADIIDLACHNEPGQKRIEADFINSIGCGRRLPEWLKLAKTENG